MNTFTIFALLFVFAVGEVSAGCYNDWRTCRSQCSSCNGGYCDWGACSAGVQVRPLGSACSSGCGTPCGGVAVVETRRCYTAVAVVHSRWSGFSAWSACSRRCGAGTQSRTRTCIRGNAYGATCVGVAVETRACGTPIINSRWTGFGAFSACSRRCGRGTQTRTRTCIRGNACGAPCVGPATESRACGTPVVHARWTGFGGWSACSRRCGAGTQTRTRRCIPGNACGRTCVGPSSESRACGTPVIHSRWTGFGPWSACSVACGTGTQTRSRSCIRGNACGAPCTGPSTETRACAVRVCARVVTRVAVVGGVGGCADVSGSCGAWGAAGFCNTYPGYMATSCCNSCQGLISAYIKEKPEQLKWTPEKYVEVMNAELKKKK